jgi:Zn-finger nucleic acid-binding protein
MPLLLCPNCNVSMQAVNRSGVELDMCPQCRGVWLDRGELEKVLGGVREERTEFQREVENFRRAPDQWRGRDYDERYRHHKKKRGFDLFDIFD